VTVIDTSAYITFLIGEEGGENIRPWIDPENSPRAVSLLLAETGNVLWNCVRAGSLPPEHAHELFTMTRTLCKEGVILLEPDEQYGGLALRLAMEHAHPFYDMLFVAQAMETKDALVTGDGAQAEVALLCGIEVVRV
jgi:predicted nucleic acid-binding protein